MGVGAEGQTKHTPYTTQGERRNDLHHHQKRVRKNAPWESTYGKNTADQTEQT